MTLCKWCNRAIVEVEALWIATEWRGLVGKEEPWTWATPLSEQWWDRGCDLHVTEHDRRVRVGYRGPHEPVPTTADLLRELGVFAGELSA